MTVTRHAQGETVRDGLCQSPPRYGRREIAGRIRRFSAAGFSLTEVIVALGLIMAAALPTLGVLSMGLGDARIAANQHQLEALRGTVRACLQDPSWPPSSNANTGWTYSAHFHQDGALARRGRIPQSGFEARLTGAAGLGFESPGLEAVKVEFLAIPSGEILGSCLVQRARPDLLATAHLP
jgi:type II secretory pathway pseudopilin PulG